MDTENTAPRPVAAPAGEDEFIYELIGYNGPTEAGIAAGAEKGRDPETALYISDERTATIASCRALDVTNGLGLRDQRAIAIVVMGALLIANRRWFSRSCNIIGGEGETTANPADVQALIEAHGTAAELAQAACSLIAATKVNWFLTNHHVGQGHLAGYARKVSIAILGDVVGASSEWYNAMWALGHWADTVHVLAGLGLPGLRPINGSEAFPMGSTDVGMRISSYPAGTAKAGIIVEVAKRIRFGTYAPIVPVPAELPNFLTRARNICVYPASYHIGAAALGVQKRVIDVPDELLRFASAYVHAIMPGTTLSKSTSLIRVEDMRDDALFATLVSTAKAVAMSVPKPEQALEIIRSRVNVGATMDSLDASLFATMAEREEAIAQAELEAAIRNAETEYSSASGAGEAQ